MKFLFSQYCYRWRSTMQPFSMDRYGARWILLKAFTFQTIKEISLCSSSTLTMYRIWFVCFFRLVLNPFYGVLLDNKGARKKKWLWHNLKEHVHAPPFQPITFMISKQLSIRCLSQVLVSMLLQSFKPQHPHANSPNRSLCISLKNELREFVKKS